MTSLVGVLCKDGVVIGADSSTTFGTAGTRTIEQTTQKIDLIWGKVIVAGTGQVGLNQRFCQVVNKRWTPLQNTKPSAIDIAKDFAKYGIEDFSHTYAKLGTFGALVAFPAGDKAHLCEFDVGDFQPELKTERIWYASMGSAQHITDTFLAFIRGVFWQGGLPTVQEAMFAVVWTLDHAVEINPGGVNAPLLLATLSKNDKHQWTTQIFDDDALGEHRQNIAEAKKALRNYRIAHQPEDARDVPQGPPLPALPPPTS